MLEGLQLGTNLIWYTLYDVFRKGAEEIQVDSQGPSKINSADW